ncbi:MAG: cysteine desulfurase [Chthoniobacter sp.]|nr:cysteine desulfurase [Chthoniobacter sp.]
MIYFDHNASHPLSTVAKEAWLNAVERFIGNPSSPHRIGARAEAALTNARERLAAMVGCDPGEIVWTSGATEGSNTVLQHASHFAEGETWVSAIEHPAVITAAQRYLPNSVRFIPVSRSGVVDLDWISERLQTQRPRLISIMAANNETGVLQPWREALALSRERGVPLFCDAAQWIGKLPSAGLGKCDYMIGCAHKFGGPLGVGFIKCSSKLRPLLVGGPQEDGQRAGTENVAGVLAMVEALEEREMALAQDATAQRLEWRTEFETRIVGKLPDIQILGTSSDRLWNTVSVLMPEVLESRQRWVVKLDKLGFAVSTGSACASGKEETSHVLAGMGFASDEASRVLRFSSGWETSREDWLRLSEGVSQAFGEVSAR